MTTPDHAALAMSAAQEIINAYVPEFSMTPDPWGELTSEEQVQAAAIITRHTQPLVERIKKLEGELAEEKKMHAECAEDQLATFKEMVARGEALAAANERDERAERARDEARRVLTLEFIAKNEAQDALTASQTSVRELREALELIVTAMDQYGRHELDFTYVEEQVIRAALARSKEGER